MILSVRQDARSIVLVAACDGKFKGAVEMPFNCDSSYSPELMITLLHAHIDNVCATHKRPIQLFSSELSSGVDGAACCLSFIMKNVNRTFINLASDKVFLLALAFNSRQSTL